MHLAENSLPGNCLFSVYRWQEVSKSKEEVVAATLILERMKKNGIRQADLARRLGRSGTWAWHVCHALLTPSPADRRAVAEYLKCAQKAIFDKETGRAAFVVEEKPMDV
jgi:cyanate lyase